MAVFSAPISNEFASEDARSAPVAGSPLFGIELPLPYDHAIGVFGLPRGTRASSRVFALHIRSLIQKDDLLRVESDAMIES
jgi:hypothetical protein